MTADMQLGQRSGRGVSLPNLPNEILHLIMEPLDITDLRNLRLVNSAMVETASFVLFRSVAFTPSMYSVSRIENIARHKHLGSYVKQIRVCACGMAMCVRATVEKQLSSGEDSEKDRLEAEAFLDECDKQLIFYKQMLVDAPEAETHVKRIRDAFASMPNLTEFSLTNFSSIYYIDSKADILIRTGFTETRTTTFGPQVVDQGRAIGAHDLAFWVRDLRPRIVEVNSATPLQYMSADPKTDFEHLNNTHTFRLVYSTALTWDSQWFSHAGDQGLVDRMSSLPATALDGLSQSLLSLRNLAFGFDDRIPLGATVPGQPDWRHDIVSGEMVPAESWQEAQLHFQRVLTSSILGQTYPHLHTVKLQSVVITDEELLAFVERHAEHLTSFAIDDIRVEQTKSIHGTLTRLAEVLRACPLLKDVQLQGILFDEHGNYLTLPRAYKQPLRHSKSDEIDPSLAELPFFQCGRFALLGQLEDYICRRQDYNPLKDVTLVDWSSLFWEKFDLPSLIPWRHGE